MLTEAEVRRNYQGAAAQYDAGYQDRRKRLRFRRIEKDFHTLMAQGHCLDVGCGTGRLLRQYKGLGNVGIDLSAEMLEAGPALAAAQASALALPFAGGAFASIIAAQAVIRYLDQAAAFAEWARVLEPGGILAVHNYAKRVWSLLPQPRPFAGHWDDLGHVRATAMKARLTPLGTRLFRSVRFYPYALPIPSAFESRAWGHAVLVFQKEVS